MSRTMAENLAFWRIAWRNCSRKTLKEMTLASELITLRLDILHVRLESLLMVPASPHVGLDVVVMDLLKHRVDVLHLEVHT